MIPRFCPSCGASIPVCVSEDDIAEAVEEQENKTAERIFTDWTLSRPALDSYTNIFDKDKDIA